MLVELDSDDIPALESAISLMRDKQSFLRAVLDRPHEWKWHTQFRESMRVLLPKIRRLEELRDALVAEKERQQLEGQVMCEGI